MRDEPAKDNRSRDQSRLDAKQRAGPFFYEKSSIFPLYLSEKAIFHHKPTLVTGFRPFKNQTTELTLKWVQIVKIYNGTCWRLFLATKKYKIAPNHQPQPTSMTFWTARETNTEENCLWLAHFSSLSDAL